MKIKILAAGIALTLPFWACAKDVTIIYTNDLHAHVEPYKVPWIADGKRDIGGWANITTLVKQKIKRHGFLMRATILPGHISAA
ncbi:hypothetical protein G832_04112 [Escherichia coli HVH 178 (4-3189163)]|nr:hypothetical protein G832_04112 [Escherichia coli HVH 178 (4-3189163)]GCO93361.1 5'-nucleotidase [Escherichia coli]